MTSSLSCSSCTPATNTRASLQSKFPTGFRRDGCAQGKSDIGHQINQKIIALLASANEQFNQANFVAFNATEKLGDDIPGHADEDPYS